MVLSEKHLLNGRLSRLVSGAGVGAGLWFVLSLALPFFPLAVRFLLSWLLFTMGPGLGAGAWLSRRLYPLHRLIVVLGIGSAAAPVLIQALGWMQALPAFPYVACALAGAGLACWDSSSTDAASSRLTRVDVIACAALVLLAAGTGAIAFWHRLAVTPRDTFVYGDYDSMDLSFYAAWAAEATHTVPPTAGYYAGHALNGAYFPQLILAMINRFGGVPMLAIYFRYGWPTFLALGALSAFAFVRLLAPVRTALLVVALMLVGGDFSYLAAWLLPHATVQWDYLIWPTNFLDTTMEILHFSTWTPSLPVFFITLFAIVHGLRTRDRRWLVASAALMAVLFEFKPFAYIVLLGGLTAAAVFSRHQPEVRRWFAGIASLAVLFLLPVVYGILTLRPEDRRSRLVVDTFLLPQRMLLKLDLTNQFANIAHRLAPMPALSTPIFLLLATILFFAGGLGVRSLGVPGVWRAIGGTSDENAASWRLLAWCVVTGVAIPFVVVTDPYQDTLQFYMTGLFLLWIFAAAALSSLVERRPVAGTIALALALVLAVPSSMHYLTMKWTDATRPPFATIDRRELHVADYLATCDAERTVVLHDRPLAPSLVHVVSARRVVLAWGHPYYAVGSQARARDVNAFFASGDDAAQASAETLRRYNVTHVLVYERDRVPPVLLSQWIPVVQSPGVNLYAVSPEAAQLCRSS